MPVDPLVLTSMIFTLLVILLIGGLIVAFPVVRRLGSAVDVWVETRREEGVPGAEAARLQARVRDLAGRLDALERRMEVLSERQDFAEALVEGERSSGRRGADERPSGGPPVQDQG